MAETKGGQSAKLSQWQAAIIAAAKRGLELNALDILSRGGSPWKLFELLLMEECEARGIAYSEERYKNAENQLRVNEWMGIES